MADTGTPIDKVISLLEQVLAILTANDGKPTAEPQKNSGGIYDFKRPAATEPKHGFGVKMFTPDVPEFIERSRYAVRYSGYLALGPSQEEEAWAEIEAIQNGDPAIIKTYAEAGIDPMLVAVLLMQGVIDPVRYDGPTFGNAAQKRAALAGQTVQTWLQNEFDVMAGGAAPSGGEYGE